MQTHLAGGGGASARGSRGSLPLVHLPGWLLGPLDPWPGLALPPPPGPMAAHAPFLSPTPLVGAPRPPTPRPRPPGGCPTSASALGRRGTGAQPLDLPGPQHRNYNSRQAVRECAGAFPVMGGVAGCAGKRRSVRKWRREVPA